MKRDISINVIWSYITSSIIIFLLVFLPPLSKISMTYILTGLMSAYLGVSIIKKGRFRIELNSNLKLLAFFSPFIMYLFFQTVLNYIFSPNRAERIAYVYNLSHILVSLFFIIISYLFLREIVTNKKIDISTCVVAAGATQAILMFLSFFVPAIHQRFLTLSLTNNKNEINLRLAFLNKWRLHGLSGYYFDNLAFILSGICLISIIKGITTKKTAYYFLAFLILFASMLTARTSIILTLIGVFVVVLHYRREIINDFLKWIIIALAGFILLIVFYSFLSEGFQQWIETGWRAFVSVFSGNRKESAFGEILGADLVLPTNLLFGVGAKPESLNIYDTNGNYIDNGYIQMLWRFGLLGAGLFLFGLLKFEQSLTKKIGIVSFALMFVFGVYTIKYYPLSLYGAHIIYFVLPAVLNVISKEAESGKNE